MNLINGAITLPQGFQATGVSAGIRKKDKKDIALIYSKKPCTAAAVYTKNIFKAAPLIVTQENLQDKKAQAVVINSGVANACMGNQGLEDAREMANLTAKYLNISAQDVIVASTGVIGVPLPMDKVSQGIEEAVKNLKQTGGKDAAQAIMTTDTKPKEVATQIEIQGKTVTIGGMAKGSGMIHPNMATMLAFLTTDAQVEAECLQNILQEVTQKTFNMISVDGDTSTNDMLAIMANGLAENPIITLDSPDVEKFKDAINKICTILAKMIAQDGEGATKLLEIEVNGALTEEDAQKGAKAICSSNLVKAAMFGEDANWGRIITALGYSGAQVDPFKVDVYLGDLLMAKEGSGLEFDEEKAAAILGEKEVKIKVNMNLGEYSARAWGCDLTYDYVKINGQYRS